MSLVRFYLAQDAVGLRASTPFVVNIDAVSHFTVVKEATIYQLAFVATGGEIIPRVYLGPSTLTADDISERLGELSQLVNSDTNWVKTPMWSPAQETDAQRGQ